ncbi:MAG: major capsid protein [Prevotella sp.]|nr:major capsid protein [Prevotella sp.]
MSIFSKIPVKKPKRSKFNLSHEVKMSADFGGLYPFFCQEVVPGDTFKMNTELFIRFAPMLAPIMHQVNVFTHFFFVPNRLVWKDWQDFITGGEDGQTNVAFPRIKIPAGTIIQNNKDSRFSGPNTYYGNGTLADYLGFPSLPNLPGDVVNTSEDIYFSQLPFRAYDLIWNEYYRDQNLQEEIDIKSLDNKPSDISWSDFIEYAKLRNRCWEKDYFTSALPWTQRGGDVHLPMTGDADVFGAGPSKAQFHLGTYNADGPTDPNNGTLINLLGPSAKGYSDISVNKVAGKEGDRLQLTSSQPSTYYVKDGDKIGYADMSNVNSATINELRKAFSLQRWLERNARAGSRYIEQIASHFGVRSSDARLQRPEFLGGGRTPVVISEVLQQSATTASGSNTPLGDMAGHGVAVGKSHSFKRFFEEHGYVIGIVSILPRTSYQQGLPRQFSKFNRFDYYWPEFANIGEQEIKEKELFLGTSDNEKTFGYQSRYSEYKYIPSQVHGDFKSTLSFWHLGRQFSSAPKLSGDFVTCGPNTENLNRIFAVQDSNYSHIWIDCYNNLRASRPMPKYGIPMP